MVPTLSDRLSVSVVIEPKQLLLSTNEPSPVADSIKSSSAPDIVQIARSTGQATSDDGAKDRAKSGCKRQKNCKRG